ncbi:UPF0260 protein YcgN [hydrothermal vent metagenome]|uniref:UPF0260 protein YcgN n=1 Tax=hydrothermal vent metagenome TaxID=652676 RepID=A0A3B0YL64_9ZZZZ
MTNNNDKFWETKSLSEMNTQEWESLCDHCARCCLLKLEDIDTEKVFYTNVSCKLLDLDKCRCTRYSERSILVPDCVTLTAQEINTLDWMPSSCAYRLLSEGKPLPDWHPLLSKNKGSVTDAGISITSFATNEGDIEGEDIQDYIIDLR